MRWLGRAVVACVLAALLAGVLRSPLFHSWQRLPAVETLPAALLAQTRRAIAYPLPDGQWLSFALKPGGGALRLLSNARVAAATPDPEPLAPAPAWRYRLEYRVLDSADGVLDSGVASFDSAPLLGRLADGSTVRVLHGERFTQAITAGRYYFLADPGAQAARVQVRVVQMQLPLEAVFMRLYQRERLNSQGSDARWARLSRTVRERLGAVSVHGAELLDARERQALLRRRWAARAPLGIEGRDYDSVQLYQLDPEVARPIDENTLALPGWPLGPGVDALLDIAPTAQRLRLEITPVADASAAAPPDALAHLHWYGRPAIRQAHWSLVPGVPFEVPIEPGRVVISAPRASRLRAWSGAPGQWQELTREMRLLRTWRLAGDDVLSYDIAHAGADPTPWRLDVRALSAVSDLDAAESLALGLVYRWLDAQGEVVHEGRLESQVSPSRYEHPRSDPELVLGEVERLYFRVPPGVVRLELRALHPLTIAAYSQPWNTARRSRAPMHSTDLPLPEWFGVRPPDWRARQRDQRSLLMRLQSPPPEVDARLLAGELHWESFLPEGRWRARKLLERVTPGALRRRALGLYYLELTAGETRELEFDALGGGVNAQLLYSRTQPTPERAQLWLDGEPFAQLDLRARAGAFDLERIAPGRHRLSIDGPQDLRVFINQVHEAFDAQVPSWRRRLALALGDEALSIPVTKTDPHEQLLTLRWYAPAAYHAPQQLHVRIEPLSGSQTSAAGTGVDWGPSRDWSFLEHHLVLGPAPDTGAIRLVHAGGEPLDDGTLSFIPLGSDLPPGTYRLHIELIDGPGGYLILSRTEPGERPWVGIGDSAGEP